MTQEEALIALQKVRELIQLAERLKARSEERLRRLDGEIKLATDHLQALRDVHRERAKKS